MNFKIKDTIVLNTSQTYLSSLTKHFWVLLCSVLLLSCASEIEQTDTLFVSKTSQETGIEFQNTLTSTPQLNILNYIYYYNGAGVAAGDFNNDGLPDLYFTANQVEDQLYLNLGNLQFKDITAEANIHNGKGWTTGVTTVDINHDGWLDIYVSKVGAYQNISGHNRLYINQGLNANGNPTFVEKAANYQLDFIGFSTQANFFDYDLDGDLDMFLLNHSVNPNQNYGKGSTRHRIDTTSGDKLFENRKGLFYNVSEAAGILQSKIGYGLAASISDTNNDGFPDIYVGNDFFENDYFYRNNGDKTFTEIITSRTGQVGHTTHFSMGNDIADINNDGFTDILSVDMLPEDLTTYKTSGTEFNYQIYQNYLNNGYTRQYMQNTLQLNNGNGSFSETAFASGVAATEWSWAPLIADFDNDGLQDIYISNGILGATNDMDFINFIANDNIQKSLGAGMQEKDMKFIDEIPKKKTTNYFFKNNGDQTFTNNSQEWANEKPSYSNGTIYVDLDNDGDLDIISNNVNSPVSVLENTSERLNPDYHWLKINFKGDTLNPLGIGAKAILFKNGTLQLKENFPTRGYLSAVAPNLHFGLGNRNSIDSLFVIWPNLSFEVHRNIAVDTMLTVTASAAHGNYQEYFRSKPRQYLTQVDPLFEYKHKENTTIEFNRNPLLAFALSNEGPDISVADVNQDGLDDVFVSGGKQQASQLWIQQKLGGFTKQQEALFDETKLNEDVAHTFFDGNGDVYPDLLVASGGNEFKRGKPIFPRVYFNKKGVLSHDTTSIIADYPLNASNVRSGDIDMDGDDDLLLLSNTNTHFGEGELPGQILLNNQNASGFMIASNKRIGEFAKNRGYNDVVIAELDDKENKEIIAAGDWTGIHVFNHLEPSKVLQEKSVNGLEFTHGFWNVIKTADFDNDGDIDIVAGNWGLNSRLRASKEEPVTLYTADFDGNGSEETVVTYFYQGIETTLASKDELVKQMPFINKNFLSYKDFAKASVTEIFGKKALANAKKQQVYELASCYFENTGNGSFKKHLLPFAAQVSTVNDLWIEDFNHDGFQDLLLVGNNFEISTQLSSLDASHGVLLLNDRTGGFTKAEEQHFDISGAARTVAKMTYQGEPYLIVTRNNDQPIFLKINL